MKGNTNAAVFSPDAFIDASYEDDTLKLTRRNGTSKSIEIAGGVQFTLKVTYSGAPDLSGITVTATPQTGTAGNPVVETTGFDGVAYLTVKQNGTYKIISSKAGYTFASTPTVTCTSQTTEASVSCYVPGTVTVTVTVSDEKGSAAGRTVTATASGQTTQTKTVVTGQTSVTFSLPAGSWTFKTDYPSGAMGGESKTLTVENNKSYSVTLKVVYNIVYGFSIAVNTADPDARVTYPQTVFGQTNAAYGKTPCTNTSNSFKINGFADCELISGIKRQTYSGGKWTDVSDKRKAVAGSASNEVYTYIPTWYMKMTNDGTNIICAFSMEQIDSTWKDYAGSVGSNHVGHFRLGCFRTPSSSSLLSYGGSSGVDITLTNTLSYAKSKGTGWDIRTWYMHTYIAALMTLLFKSTDLQATLGNGVSSGSRSSQSALTFTNDYGMYGDTSDKTKQMSFFWMQNIYGDLWEWCGGAKTSPYKLMTCTGYSSTDEADFDKKSLGGLSSNLDGAIKTVVGTTDAGFFPTDCSGSYTTYFADRGGVYFSSFPSVGGGYNGGTYCGPFFAYFGDDASDTDAVRPSYRL